MISMVICTPLTDAWIVWVRSPTTCSFAAAGSEAVSAGSRVLDPLDRIDDVEARQLVDVDDHRALVLQPGGFVDVLRCIHRGANIRQADRRAVPVGDDQRLVGIGAA